VEQCIQCLFSFFLSFAIHSQENFAKLPRTTRGTGPVRTGTNLYKKNSSRFTSEALIPGYKIFSVRAYFYLSLSQCTYF